MATKNFTIDRSLSNVTAQDFGSGLGDFSGSNSNDDHLPVGYTGLVGGETYVFDPVLLRFALDFSDVISISSAHLHVKKTTGSHVSLDGSVSVRVRRVTSAWSEHGGSEGNWSGAREDPSTTSSGSVTDTVSSTPSVWKTFDITSIVNSWLGGSTNNGLELYVDPASSKTTEFYSMDASASNEPYIDIVYVDNTPPSAPTLTAPASASVQTTATPSFQFTHVDADGDALVSYDIQVDDSSAFGSPAWDGANLTTGISGNNVTVTYAGSALARGTTYYWRVRTNDGTDDGTWSATRSFVYNSLPTVASRVPGSAALGTIWNVGSDLALWSASEAKPRFSFTYNDANSHAMTKYRLRIYNDSAGVQGALLYSSGDVTLAAVAGATVTIDSSQGLANGTQYWWTIDVFDGYEWAGESSATKFKLRWAQGMFEQDTTSASSTNWSMSSGTVTQTVALLFSSSTGAARTGTTEAWYTAMSSVPKHRYMQVLVRLTTATAGSGATLADMTFSYYAAPSTPDGWTAS